MIPAFHPTFVFDSHEAWKPVGVEESMGAFGYEWGDLGFGAGWITPPSMPGERMVSRCVDFPAKIDHHKLGRLPPVVYRRTLIGGPLAWDQYWLWYVYNPWSVAGIGKHEGDWEFVQVGRTAERASRPVLVTCSQHHSGGKREWWTVEVEGDGSVNPVIYVAWGSHANYFAPGSQGGGLDHCDGTGLVLRPDNYVIREFGDWATWPGRWGNSTGEGKSPESPGCQGHRWTAPHLFHSGAK